MRNLFYLLLVALLLVACDRGAFDNHDAVDIKQVVYVVPDGYSLEVETNILPTQSIVVEKGQSVKFIAGYSINGELSTHDSTSQYYTSILWEIDGEYFNINSFRYTFTKTGFIEGSLRTVDLLGDTLVSLIEIYVNTPESLSLDFPYNGYNMAIPHKSQDLPFRWSIDGVDEWETASCDFFLSTEKDEIWLHPLGTTDCNEGADVWGPLVGDSTLLYTKMKVDLRKQSYTFYWAVRYTLKSYGATKRVDSSEVRWFTTKMLNDSLSTLNIPIQYKDFYLDKNVSTTITIVSSSNDTLKVLHNKVPSALVQVDLKAETGITVYLEEESKKDYTPHSFKIDLPAGGVVYSDTVFFEDHVPPQIAVVNDSIDEYQSVELMVYDDGSGVSEMTLKVYIDGEDTPFKYYNNRISIPEACGKVSCNFSVLGSDYARNKLPELYWTIEENKYSYIIRGPFPYQEATP